MVTSFILMNVKRQAVNDIAEALLNLSGISEVYSVTGQYDLVAIARVNNNDDLAELVTDKLSKIDDIERTDTMLAFKTYSRHDLDAMFAV
ncbi:MAG TPA: Lrp/AsnC ligand binding domain-containing protein [Gammaproteobacteria bacterium]